MGKYADTAKGMADKRLLERKFFKRLLLRFLIFEGIFSEIFAIFIFSNLDFQSRYKILSIA